MDGIHDMGGMQGFGHVQQLTAAPPFAEPWEGKAFVIGALAARISGTNLHAFRHAIERVPPRGLIDEATVENFIKTYEQSVGPMNGAKVVARAWTDPEYRARLDLLAARPDGHDHRHDEEA